MLEFRTFGTIDLRSSDGERLEGILDRPKRLALLAVLAAHQRSGPVRREKLLSLLWPESSPSNARTALSTTLSRLRQDLGEGVLRGRGTQAVGLAGDRFRSDVAAFESALEEDRHREAAELYEGPFLEGFRARDARAFEAWVDRRREDYRQRAYRAAMEAAAVARDDGDAAAAEACLRRAREIEPLREEAVRELVELLAREGDPAPALRVLRAFRDRLDAELGLAPSDELERLADEVRAGRGEGDGATGGGGSAGTPSREGDAPPEDDAPPAAGDEGRSPAGLPGLPDRGSAWVLVAALLAAAVAGWLVYAGARPAGGGSSGAAGGGETTVAVLPFHVSGAAADAWRDGMVTLLTTGLDGAAGVRAVSDRAVLAAWEETASAAGGSSGGSPLAVARRLGARYAVVGSAVVVGRELRLSAAVREVASGAELGRTQVRGPPDSVASLADELAGRVLGVLAEETGRGLQSADVASVTTRSLPALRAYLAGERHFRAGDFGAATEDYRRAVAEDSTFALAHWRLASALGWQVGGHAGPHRRRARELAEQLPRRERRIVRAGWLFWERGQVVAAVDSLRRLTGDYPDDPAAWFQLGDVIMHGGHPGGWTEGDSAFRRAVELDPRYTPYYIHHVALAVALHHDSALAARRAARHPEPEELEPWFPLATALAFGDADRRRRALQRLDSLPDPADVPVGLLDPALFHPRDQAMGEAMLRRYAQDSVAATALVQNLLRRGRVAEAVRFLPRAPPNTPVACGLSDALSLGYPLPDSVLRAHLEPSGLGEDPDLGRLLCSGVYLAERRREEALSRVTGRLRETATDTAGEPAARRARARDVLDVLRGYRAWQTGDLRRAARLLSRSVHVASHSWASWRGLWRGDVYSELGDLRTAEGWYLATWWHPLAHQRLGRLYERMDRPERAAAAYRRFIAAWEGADAPLQGRVEAARERLSRLTPVTREAPGG